MNFLGNIIWLLLGGLITSLMYFVAGLLMCITIIGIPFGLQMWKFAIFSLMPFGSKVVSKPEQGCLTIGFNIIWVLFGWWEIAFVHLVFGALFCITIIGIPFGIQHFKIALYSLLPFGRTFE